MPEVVNLNRLRVSLTKNGYMKIAEVLKRHPRWEVLDHVSGSIPGIDVKRSQAANIMGASVNGDIPECWDEIRSHSDAAIESFVFVAVVLSHCELITALKGASQGNMKGYLTRTMLRNEKTFTNLHYAMACVGVADYMRGEIGINYDLRAVVFSLRTSNQEVKSLVESKLRKAGWHPQRSQMDFWAACQQVELHKVFGLSVDEFQHWLSGTLEVVPPTRRLGFL